MTATLGVRDSNSEAVRMNEIEILDSPYVYSASQMDTLAALANRVSELRRAGKLTPEVLYRIRNYFRVKNIYHSNAIEGNSLDAGETRQVVEHGMTLTGKSLKDQAEAKNLGQAIDFLEDLIANPENPITESDIRQIHGFVLKGVDDDNAGAYRRVSVAISGSQYPPPGPESVPAKMTEFGSWLRGTMSAAGFASVDGILAAAVAHTWFVHVHPFVDGNGRVARLLMNLVLMRFGIPVAIIAREDRMRYYDALEEAQASDLSSFLSLLCECIHESLEQYEEAAAEQQARQQWVKKVADKFGARERVRAENEYEVWKSAVDLLKGYMRQTAQMLSDSTPHAQIHFKDYGHLGFEKYVLLKSRKSTKRTWSFRVDFRSGDCVARYLFFFGYASRLLQDRCGVTLWISREEPPGTFFYTRLDDIDKDNVPGVRELGYVAKDEKFVSRLEGDKEWAGSIESIGRTFYDDVIRKHFSS